MADDFDIDSVIEKMNQDQPAQESGVQEEVPEQKPASPEHYEVNIGGDKRKVTLSQLVDNYQKGMDYETKMGTLKKERMTFDQERSKWDSNRLKELDEIDQFYRNNPDQWEYIKEQYTNRSTPNDPDAAVQDLNNRLRFIEDTIKSVQAEREERHIEKLQTELTNGFLQAKKDYDFLPWNQSADGLTLEDRVMKYMADNKIEDVDTAIFKMFKPDILNYQKDSGKRAAVEEVKKNSELGIVGISNSPSTPQSPKRIDPRGKSINEVIDWALKNDYGL